MKTEKADLILENGIIYTVDPANTIAEAVAVKDGKIIYVGSNGGSYEYRGDNTKIMNLAGKMVLPGFIDTHVHAPGAMYAQLYKLNLNGINTEPETMEAIKAYIKDHPEMESYYGDGFNMGAFSGEEASRGPRKGRLDEICSAKPIFLVSSDLHSMWVNSKALSDAGITKSAADPEHGRIERDPLTSEPWGTLRETAKYLMPFQKFTDEEKEKAMLAFQEQMHRWGFTGMLAITGGSISPAETLKNLSDRHELKMRVNTSLTIFPDYDVNQYFKELENLKHICDSELLKVTTVKILLDGVIEGVSAYLTRPYESGAGQAPDYRGMCMWAQEALNAVCAEANQRGFQIHAHSIGDAATQSVLDAFEQAKRNSPQRDDRNSITHLQLVKREDVGRLADLNVIAVLQPFWMFKEPKWWETIDHAFLGERAEEEYPLKSFIDKGVVVTSSSDHPVTPANNPLIAIQAGITRNLVAAEEYDDTEPLEDMDDARFLLNKKERASLEDMIRSYTVNAAYALFREKETGTVEAGKRADLVVLDRNLFEVSPLEIHKVKVVKTIFNGEIVYQEVD